jgi:predicted site-specific integrase-resolvase
MDRRLLISEAEAACRCGVSKTTFRRWVTAGFVRPVETPLATARKLYRPEAVEQAVASLRDAC